jgi:hypothetical protein
MRNSSDVSSVNPFIFVFTLDIFTVDNTALLDSFLLCDIFKTFINSSSAK